MWCLEIDFPQLLVNQLTVHQGQTLILTAQNLNATDNSPSSSLNFIVSNISHGYFAFVNNPSQPVTQFIQSEVWAQQVEFVHDGSPSAPSYQVQVIRPRNCSVSTVTECHSGFFIIEKPVLTMNPFTIHKGKRYLSLLNF